MKVGAVGRTMTEEMAQLRQEIAALRVDGKPVPPAPAKDDRLEKHVRKLAAENASLRRALDQRRINPSSAPSVRTGNHE